MEAQEDFASPICREDLPRSGRLMSFFEAMMLVLLRQFATAIVARLAVWGRWIVVADRKFKLHAKPSRLLYLAWNLGTRCYQHFYVGDQADYFRKEESRRMGDVI